MEIFGWSVILFSMFFYAFDYKSHWFILLYSITCLLYCIYAYFLGSLGRPIILENLVWACLGFFKWYQVFKNKQTF